MIHLACTGLVVMGEWSTLGMYKSSRDGRVVYTWHVQDLSSRNKRVVYTWHVQV